VLDFYTESQKEGEPIWSKFAQASPGVGDGASQTSAIPSKPPPPKGLLEQQKNLGVQVLPSSATGVRPLRPQAPSGNDPRLAQGGTNTH